MVIPDCERLYVRLVGYLDVIDAKTNRSRLHRGS